MFIDALDVDDVIAHLLVTEGFSSVEEVAFVPTEDLTDIEGFDESVAAELQQPRPRLPRGTGSPQHRTPPRTGRG